MYAIVKTGGKQYRVEEGQSLLVERLPVSDGDSVDLQPLLVVDGSKVVDGADLSSATVSARVVAHERGPKLRVVKFKPKRGYKRRTGHRQELTRLEVVGIKLAGSGGRRGKAAAAGSEPGEGAAPKPVAAEPRKPRARRAPSGEGPSGEGTEAAAPAKAEAAAKRKAPAKAAEPEAPETSKKEADNGA